MKSESPSPLDSIERKTRLGMITLMIITHTAVAVLILTLVATIGGWHFLVQLLLVMIAGGVLGAVLMWGVLDDLGRVENALQRLGQGLPVAPLPTKNREPMRFLMEHVNTLIARERELASMRQQLRGQIGEAAAQEERSRLARDLHDSIKQQIFSISVSAAAAQARWEKDSPGAQKALADVRKSAQEAMVEMRAMLQQLAPAPLEKVGLSQALRDQCEALEYRSGARVTCEIGALPPDDKLPPGAQEAIFRVAQEALTNIARHARATQVTLTLHEDEEGIQLAIIDDGQGFDMTAAAQGMGLANMRVRAEGVGGQFRLNSECAKGTKLVMHVPYLKPMIAEESALPALNAAAQGYFASAIRRSQLGSPSLFVALTMLFAFAFMIGRDDLAGWEFLLGIAFGGAGALVSILSGRVLVRGLRDMRALRREVGDDAPQMLITRYNLWLGICLLPLFIFIFLPEAVISLFGSLPAVFVGVLGFVGVFITFIRAFGFYRRYIEALSLPALRAAANEDFAESTWSRYSWIWALPMLLNLFSALPVQFPPLERGDWLDVSMPICGFVFLAAGITFMRYHHAIRRRLSEETAS